MRFMLRRDIPTDKKGNVPIKQVLRHQFHGQLKMLWDTTSELAGLRDRGLPIGRAKSKGITFDYPGHGSSHYRGALKGHDEYEFIPLVTYRCGWECAIDVRFLIRQDRINTLNPEIGDADKRVRILLDALRIPQDDKEVDWTVESLPSPLYCLLEDDSIISRMTVETMPLLNEPRDQNIDADMDQLTHVAVTLTPRLSEFSWVRS